MSLPATMTIMLGLPGAGKSTYVKHRFSNPDPPRLVICMDDLRQAYGHRYSEDRELDVLWLTLDMADRALRNCHHVVIDESVTRLTTATALTAVAANNSAWVEMIELTTPVFVCWQRRKRSGFPIASFMQKEREWRENKGAIIALARTHTRIDMEESFSEEATTTTTHQTPTHPAY